VCAPSEADKGLGFGGMDSLAPAASIKGQMRIPKASELIAAQLRRRIVMGELSEDEGLASESALMEEFNVSRPTLREAYRILESEGLLTIRRGARGGARVHKPKADVAARYAAQVLQSQGALLSDIYDARLLLEGPVVELAANAGKVDFARLRSLNEQAEAAADDLVAVLDIHHGFHNALLEMTDNMTLALLAKMIDLILDQADFRHVTGRLATDAAIEEEHVASRRAQRTHVQLVDLIEAGETVAADGLWRSHLADAAKLVLTHSKAQTALEVMN
jgi:DNA-binding FadR family transcriptional regulator